MGPSAPRQSRVIFPPVRTTFIGPVVALALWTLIGVIWFTLPVGDVVALSQNIGEFVGVSTLYIVSLAFFLQIDSVIIERQWGGRRGQWIANKVACVLAFVLALTHLIIVVTMRDSLHGPTKWIGIAAVVVLGVSLILAGVYTALRYRPEWREKPFPFTLLVSPPFDMWLGFHNLLAAYLVVALFYSTWQSAVLAITPGAFALVIIIVTVGLVLWTIGSLWQWRVVGGRKLVVTGVREISPHAVEVTMEPTGAKSVPVVRPGQFVKLVLPGVPRGPFAFTEVCIPATERMQFAVKVTDPNTRVLREKLGVGVMVRVRGPYGETDIRTGAPRQLWVAGGMGITTFIAWLRAIGAFEDEKVRRSGVKHKRIRRVAAQEVLQQLGLQKVDLWYFHHNEPAYLEELEFWESRFAWLTIHTVNSHEAGRISADELVGSTRGLHVGHTEGVSAVVCGPKELLREYSKDLRRLGVKPVLREDFSFR